MTDTKTKEFINKAIKIHGDRYDYSKVVYIKAKEKVNIICIIHGDFLQTPNGHLNGKGCIKCSGNYTPTTEEWIVKARKVHNDKYDYSKVIYKDKECKIIIICLIHGEFEQAPHSHLNGNGCPIRGINKMKQSQKKSIDLFIEQSKIIHGHKYDYTNVIYDNTNTKVNIY